ncbi:hypothetical protein CEXT_259281 [Caerostris extrusa]|uniref:CRC domain-containing protein n=1 Tax=Caerostris extrusa TaxID=172846 RepID=A0AAV4PAG6_CAEEX|nr:hypothetical protein CEXT_259281 [Caerostris extrusa]
MPKPEVHYASLQFDAIATLVSNTKKRSCNVRGEECFKDIECCTGECVCSKNACKCGNRPKVKVSKLMQPQSMAQRLICRYR